MKLVEGPMLVYDLFVFDLDGTLISSKDLMIRALRHCYGLAGRSQSPDFDQFFSLMGCPLEDIFSKIGLPVSLAESYRSYSSANIEAIKPYSDVFDAIRHLNRIGKRAAINTGKEGKRTLEILDVYGLSDCFEIVVASDDVARGKPHPDGLNKILHKLDILPESAVMVGDSRIDMECAKRAGVDGALALWDRDATEVSPAGRPRWRFDTTEAFGRAVGYSSQDL